MSILIYIYYICKLIILVLITYLLFSKINTSTLLTKLSLWSIYIVCLHFVELLTFIGNKYIYIQNILYIIFRLVNDQDYVYLIYLTFFIGYAIAAIFIFFLTKLGSRSILYTAEFFLSIIIAFAVVLLIYNLKYHIALCINIGDLMLSSTLTLNCWLQFDILSLTGIILIGVLTGIILLFGVEYLTREGFINTILSNLMLFSASIFCFLVSYNFGLMIFFWELVGVFSILLVDTYYSRIRTTQATTRTYTLNRFSDFWMFIAFNEILTLCQTDVLSVLFKILPSMQFNCSVLSNYLFEFTSSTIIIFSIFMAAACKCAQFLLFVWLPDAMEAPTPASALIHSSTLVVMGIYMLLRFSPILYLAINVLKFMLILGAITVAYGSIYAILTSDLKKCVAYSTISQIGYLFCGCAMLAFKATLIYLFVHAISKALLFILVGYIVHMFGGTTSLRKMGGVFYVVPDISINMFILCLILAGAPYTLGFVAKELIVYALMSLSGPLSIFVLSCWIIAFLCTPIYLYRVCILPLFGRPRASRRLYRNIAPLYTPYNFIKNDGNDVYNTTYLHKFINNIQKWAVAGRFTTLIYCIVILLLLFIGEFFIALVCGYFGTSTTLFSSTPVNDDIFLYTTYYVTSYYRVRNIQLLIIILFSVATLYYMIVNNQTTYNIIYIGIVIPVILIILVLLITNSLFDLIGFIV